MKLTHIIAIVAGVLSLLLLMNSLWWIGVICAGVGAVLSGYLLRKGNERDKRVGLVGIILVLVTIVIYYILFRMDVRQ